MARFLIAAAHKSSGKTVISTGLAASLRQAGYSVQCFKKGPDYIDPMWLSEASQRPCYNLDFNTMSDDEIQGLFSRKSGNTQISLIEANKGLFDGVNQDGSDSNAQLAKLLQAPVILAIDCAGMTRGIAPLLLGYANFDAEVHIAGVILNRVGGDRHERKLRAAVADHTDLPVLGAISESPDLIIGERHLGLTTPAESGKFAGMIQRFADNVGSSLDLEDIANIAGTAPDLPAKVLQRHEPQFQGLKIGIAQDVSFGFYYADDLEAFMEFGAELVPFDTLSATELPEIDGLFIGGGFPEMQMAKLATNSNLRADIKTKILSGLPTYAECGGLMYLCNSLQWGDEQYPMCGVIDATAVMQDRPQGRGLVRYSDIKGHPWAAAGSKSPAHEFHYARLEGLDSATTFGRKITRGFGINGKSDGIVIKNLLAGFCHLRNSQGNPWVENFLGFVSSKKS